MCWLKHSGWGVFIFVIALTWARDLQLGIADFEFDSKTVVDNLFGSKHGVSNYNVVIIDCKHLIASDLVVSDVRFI